MSSWDRRLQSTNSQFSFNITLQARINVSKLTSSDQASQQGILRNIILISNTRKIQFLTQFKLNETSVESSKSCLQCLLNSCNVTSPATLCLDYNAEHKCLESCRMVTAIPKPNVQVGTVRLNPKAHAVTMYNSIPCWQSAFMRLVWF
jgi:hypothetical protein